MNWSTHSLGYLLLMKTIFARVLIFFPLKLSLYNLTVYLEVKSNGFRSTIVID